MRKTLRRLLSLCMILIVMLCFPIASAEETTDLVLPQRLFRMTVSGMFQMQANAINGNFTDREQKYYVKKFSAYDAAHPAAVAMFDLTQEQLEALGLGRDTGKLLSALNQSINSQFSTAYPALMDAIGLSQSHKLTDLESNSCVLLVYDYDMVLMLAVPGTMYMTGFMSTKQIANDFGEAYVGELLTSVGLTDVTVTVYRDDGIENIRTSDTYSQFDPYGRVKLAAAMTEDSMALLPYLVDSGLVDGNDAAAGWIAQYLSSHSGAEETSGAMEFISAVIAPALEERGSTEWGRSGAKMITAEVSDLPVFTYQGSVIAPEDKVLVVYHDEEKDTYSINAYLTAALSRVPANVEDADKILLVSTHWVQTGTSNGIDIYKAVSEVTVHDGKTGICLTTLGRQEDQMTGFHVVSGKVYRENVHWDRIAELVWSVLEQGEN